VNIVVRLGSTGSGPANARRRLKAHGYDTHQTGAWNSADMKQAMLFQKKHGLRPDGIVGTLTWIQLLRPVAAKPAPIPPPHPPSKPPVVVPPKPTVWIPVHGIDAAFTHPDYAKVAAAGYKFVARYVSNDPSKDLTKAEAADIAAHGMKRVLVGESTANRALQGHAAGVQDATKWSAQAAKVGLPTLSPIYFAADFDEPDPTKVVPYFDGACSVLGVRRVGCYGGLNVIKHLFDTKAISFGWQSAATSWDHGVKDTRAQLHQLRNGVQVPGATGNWADIDVAIHENYGGW
jgi:hypothetical protein